MEKYNAYVEKYRGLIMDALAYIWKNPESGFREWKTHAYMAEVFEKLGYAATKPGISPVLWRMRIPAARALRWQYLRKWMR